MADLCHSIGTVLPLLWQNLVIPVAKTSVSEQSEAFMLLCAYSLLNTLTGLLDAAL